MAKVGDDEFGLFERADEVFPKEVSTPTLPPMLESGHRQERGGHLNKGQPAQIGCRDKTVSPTTPPPMTVSTTPLRARDTSPRPSGSLAAGIVATKLAMPALACAPRRRGVQRADIGIGDDRRPARPSAPGEQGAKKVDQAAPTSRHRNPAARSARTIRARRWVRTSGELNRVQGTPVRAQPGAWRCARSSSRLATRRRSAAYLPGILAGVVVSRTHGPSSWRVARMDGLTTMPATTMRWRLVKLAIRAISRRRKPLRPRWQICPGSTCR